MAGEEERKRDEIIMAVKGRGMGIKRNQGRPSVTVELAGDRAVEIAGITWNPLGEYIIKHAPRLFKLSLSTDGTNFETVLHGEALPLHAKQTFILEQPISARYARLRFLAGFSGEDQPPYGLGKWKVIARPGTGIPGTEAFNLADPDLGGHVVWSHPTISHNWDDTF